jgi:hypothetical protein
MPSNSKKNKYYDKKFAKDYISKDSTYLEVVDIRKCEEEKTTVRRCVAERDVRNLVLTEGVIDYLFIHFKKALERKELKN